MRASAVTTGSTASLAHWLTAGLVGFARGWNDCPKIAALGLVALRGSSGMRESFALVTIATIGSTRDTALEQIRNSPQANGQNAQALVDGIIAAATVWAIITLIFWAVVFVLFAYFMRRGANWARIVLTVLTALSLLNVLAGYGVGFLQFAATVAALVLIWLRPSNEYFAAVRASKAPRA